MTLDKLIPCVMIAVGLFGGSSVTADSKDPNLNVTAVPLGEGRVIDGSVEPERIHDSFKYKFLISGYELRERFRCGLNAEDAPRTLILT